jgi:hypothetical protein
MRAAALDVQLRSALEAMLDADDTITFRAIVRRIPEFRNASALTRSASRRALVLEYQARQNGRREWFQKNRKRSADKMAALLARKDEEIAELRRAVSVLTASHKALLLAVGEAGGMDGWKRFFPAYKAARVIAQGEPARTRTDEVNSSKQ